MEQTSTIDLDKIQKYVDAERNKLERAKHNERRAQLDQVLEDFEATRTAAAKADRERREASDPNAQAAKMVYAALGPQWPAFMTLMARANMAQMASALTRLNREREADALQQATAAAPLERLASKEAADAQAKVVIERELAALGILDCTADI